jgi:endonuclease/exonuclease/phosphatase (EEP) superfamily protein YafD
MVPWAEAMRRLEERTGTVLVGPVRFSFRPWHLQPLLPIDHVLLPFGLKGRSALVGGLGSDHLGLWVRVSRVDAADR